MLSQARLIPAHKEGKLARGSPAISSRESGSGTSGPSGEREAADEGPTAAAPGNPTASLSGDAPMGLPQIQPKLQTKEQIYAQVKAEKMAKRQKQAAKAAVRRRADREREVRALERGIAEDGTAWSALEDKGKACKLRERQHAGSSGPGGGSTLLRIRLADVPVLSASVLSCDGAEDRGERFKASSSPRLAPILTLF